MTGFVLGLALIASPVPGAGMSAATAESPRAVVDFDGPSDPDLLRRELKPRPATSRAQTSKRKKFSPTDRVIAVAAGVAVGWVVGGAIGFKVTSTSNPYDDTSGLKGVMIGAPIGGAAGGLLGYWLTNR